MAVLKNVSLSCPPTEAGPKYRRRILEVFSRTGTCEFFSDITVLGPIRGNTSFPLLIVGNAAGMSTFSSLSTLH